MEDLERIKSRLDNIRSVAPILTALRNIAAGSWRLARTRLEAARVFTEELGTVLAALQSHLKETPKTEVTDGTKRVGLVVVASERGLCGAFNTVVLNEAADQIEAQREKGYELDIFTLGAKATRYFERQGLTPRSAHSLPVTTVPSLGLVQRLYRKLTEAYASDQYQRIDILYTPYQIREASPPMVAQILPIKVKLSPERETAWPEPIIDSDPRHLYEQVRTQWALTELYRYVIESAASEQSARFRVLDGASSNTERLIEELTLSYNAARQHAITMEMLDLVGGADLLKSGRDETES
jgi:F-type H+-transporting ATPase subunit gamma